MQNDFSHQDEQEVSPQHLLQKMLQTKEDHLVMAPGVNMLHVVT
jgi:hypothetical protein